MQLAIDEMRKSSGDGPKVGAVVMVGGKVVGVGHRKPGLHAERSAIEAAVQSNAELGGAKIFTTLEPCVDGSSDRKSCAELIKDAGITTVYIGRYDTNPNIYRKGWGFLRNAGLKLYDFDAERRAEIDQVNHLFAGHFTSGVGPSGGARFDYQLNGGNFEIRFSSSDSRRIVTRWTHRGNDSIYAYASRPFRVALARYATHFGEIDDPGAFDFSHTVPVNIGEIAVFASEDGAVLVKVLEVGSGATSGADQRFVKIQYQVRAGAA